MANCVAYPDHDEPATAQVKLTWETGKSIEIDYCDEHAKMFTGNFMRGRQYLPAVQLEVTGLMPS